MTPGRGAGPWLAAAAVLLWLGAWLWAGRYALLDDALIHLRFAHHLRDSGVFSFDGVTPSYGSSSPLFVVLLAALAVATSSPLLGKGLSLVGYGALLAMIAVCGRRHAASGAGWRLVGLVLLSPMALLWLTDGMESALAAFLAGLIALTTLAGLDSPPPAVAGWRAPFLLFALGAVAVLIRVELSLAILFAVAASATSAPASAFLRRQLPLALGAAVGAGALLLAFGSLLPDTAVAKGGAPSSPVEAGYQVARSTVSSLTLGGGLAGAWIASLVALLRPPRAHRPLGLLLANLLLPALVILIAWRGQTLQGVRHVLWAYAFLVVWNLRLFAAWAPSGRPPARLGRRWPALLAALLLAAWIPEGIAVARVLRARSDLLLAMREQGLRRLSGFTGGAFDIGFVAFFSGARVLDFNGLVHGREVAALAAGERWRRLAASTPDFLFVSDEQAAHLAPFLDLGSYRVCHRYRMKSLTREKDYFLALNAGAIAHTGWSCVTPLNVPRVARLEQ